MAELSAQAPSAPTWERRSRRRAEERPVTAAGLDLLRVLGWLVLHDVALPDDPERVIDHVLAGPSGVYVVNNVTWSGPIVVDDDVLICAGTPRMEAVAAVSAAADSVRELLGGPPVAALLSFVRLQDVFGVVSDVALCATENVLEVLTSQEHILDSRELGEVSRTLAQELKPGRLRRRSDVVAEAPERHRPSLLSRLRIREAAEPPPVVVVPAPVVPAPAVPAPVPQPVVPVPVTPAVPAAELEEFVVDEPVVDPEPAPPAHAPRHAAPVSDETEAAAASLARPPARRRLGTPATPRVVRAAIAPAVTPTGPPAVAPIVVPEAAPEVVPEPVLEPAPLAVPVATPVPELVVDEPVDEELVVDEPVVEEPVVEEPVVEEPVVEEAVVDERPVAVRVIRSAPPGATRRTTSAVAAIRDRVSARQVPPVEAGDRESSPAPAKSSPTDQEPARHRTGLSRALGPVIVGALIVAAVIGGAPRVPTLVAWGEHLFTADQATTIGTPVSAPATDLHPAAEFLAVQPVVAHLTSGANPARGRHLVAVQVRIRSGGTERWDFALAKELSVVDSIGVSHRPDNAVRTIKEGSILPAALRIKPHGIALGYVVFAVPDGRDITSVELGLGPASGDALTWQVPSP